MATKPSSKNARKVNKLPTIEVGVAVYADGQVTPQESFGFVNDLSFLGFPAPVAKADPVVRKEGAFGTRDYFVGFKLVVA